MKNKITVIIADDHPVFRRGLQMIISSDKDLDVIGEAADGIQAVELIGSTKPDVAVLDVTMPGLNGFDVVRNVQQLGLPTRIIFLTMHRDEAMFNAAMDLGAMGYLLKESAVEDIAGGIRIVAGGEYFISPVLADFIVNRRQRAASFAGEKSGINDLTKTEQQILKFIAEDKTSREIGELLFISVRTVERHRQNIANKLDIRGSNSLLKFAVANKELFL